MSLYLFITRKVIYERRVEMRHEQYAYRLF